MRLKLLVLITGMVSALISQSSLASEGESRLETARLSQVVMIEASLRCFSRHGISKQNQADFVRGVLSLDIAGEVLLSEK